MLLVAPSLSGFWGFGKSNIEFPKRQQQQVKQPKVWGRERVKLNPKPKIMLQMEMGGDGEEDEGDGDAAV